MPPHGIRSRPRRTRFSLSLAALALALHAVPSILVAAVVLGARDARAEKADEQKPIVWSGARLTGKRNQGGVDIVELEGNVVVNQGTRAIQADRAVIRQNPDGTMSATAYGNPIKFREKRDGADEFVEAFAQRAEYDGQKKLLELFDKAMLRRDKDEIRASYISYNTETEAYRAEGLRGSDAKAPDPESRVRGVFQPRTKDAKGESARLQPAPVPKGKD